MDPYESNNKQILSPLDKAKKEESPKESESKAAETKNEAENEKKDSQKEKSQKDSNQKDSNKDSFEPSSQSEPEPEPTFMEHLTDLRKQLVKGAIVFALIFVLVLSTINFWFPYVTRGHELIILGPLEVVKFYMSISGALAIGLALPFLCHFLWQFVSPGLTERESKFLSFYSPVMLLLFVGGIAFGYFIVNPISYNFLTSLGAINFNVMVSAQEYASFLLLTTIPLGLLFELPIVAMFLAVIGILTTESMTKIRKWSYLSLGIISALITPPDFISQLIVLIPMIGLYEISIVIVRRIEFRQAAPADV